MKNKTNHNWEKELSDLCFEMRNRTYGSHYRVLVKFIRYLLFKEKHKWLKELQDEKNDLVL